MIRGYTFNLPFTNVLTLPALFFWRLLAGWTTLHFLSSARLKEIRELVNRLAE